MIELLCRSGADPDAAVLPGLTHGEFEAVRALLRLGGTLTLPVAAAIGDTETAGRALGRSSEEDRRLALAFAAQFGRPDIVRLLLNAGVDPSSYNPVGTHSHSTPLHQAALAGHLDVVRLLVERGASLDLKDTLFQGTPLDWAHHAGNNEIEEYLLTHA
jgi:ankyrin repeat protein